MSIEIIHDEPIVQEGFHNFDVIMVRAVGNRIDVWWRCIDCGKRRYRSIRVQSGRCVEVEA